MQTHTSCVAATAVLTLIGLAGLAAQNRIDLVTPAAPDLAGYGPYAVGVRTLLVTDPDRPDVLATKAGGPTVRSPRRLTLEIWYPALLAAGQKPTGMYRTITRDPALSVTLVGRAVRDSSPHRAGPFPLVVISHGYPGNRLLMSHLGENLASKGFVIASIDHADSTYGDQKAIASTLYNRPFDQVFVLREMARLGDDGASFLNGIIDATRTGIIGYSMGGYGVVNAVGGGFSDASVSFAQAPPNRMLAERAASNPSYMRGLDARVKAAIAIGPWGMQTGYWDTEGLKGIRTPILFVAGSADQVSGYENGTRALFEGAVNATRYLLTFVNAGHNAGAPIPAPIETLSPADPQRANPFTHYADPVWDTTRMNNILAHFATAFFERHVKGDESKQAYLDLVPNGRDGVFAVDRDGAPTPTHTYWKGFKRGTTVGLEFLKRLPAGANASP